MVLELALTLMAVVSDTSPISAPAERFLFLLAMVAGGFAALRRQGTL
jgi:hypothetical protein